ncbi:CDP-glycerol glycerophosphotransferase family protein [Paenibacillus sp. UNC451MF]|uniref:CDP-glycerol glycerophosphotransferase family protein n=1 Tax=Paenibacillus sp. UNC451MF TaxID=1449063 RepID=UPI000690C089|nr:CDP-glycerol glycerophosphotransferase family protein [Paenibacillus sp. UNC451MF]
MRIEHKKQVLELTDTLKEALLFLNTPEAITAEYLKDDCLACIAHIASELGEVQDKEYISFCVACQEDINKRNFAEAYKSADMLSTWIEECVQVHYEIAFLPYKAEMWDALDSVWRAVSADPSCIVRTIPIPYYTFDSQGEAVSAEYDGDRFPSYVEVTHYNDYDLSLQRPDVIFIHNPYDDCNTVTMVHPHFFSSNLINYTDKLVYIPYYVSLGKLVHSFRLPSYKNAWKIFVQSESTRQEFLESGEVQPSQVVALGSPKIDYVYNRMQEGTAMSLEWEAALKGRTVFLFNSTLGRLLNEKEDIIKSMEEIFRFFQKRQDIALIWRPHPLSIKTLQSMLPHLLDSYLSLVEEFKKIPNAVYDESQDMHTAIILSDAYIGDFSSVIAPYAVTGKPILKLFPNIKSTLDNWGVHPAWLDYNEESTMPITVNQGIVSDNLLIFPSNNRGGFFSLDLTTEKLSHIHDFFNRSYIDPQLFVKVCNYQDILWFVPGRSSEVINYYRKTDEIKSHPLPPISNLGERCFSTAVQYEHYLWMLPAQSTTMVRLHMETGEMLAYKIVPDDFIGLNQEDVCLSGTIHNDLLWVTLRGNRSLIQIDPVSGDMVKQDLDFLQNLVRAVVSDGQALWLITENSSVVYKWNPQTNAVALYDQWPEEFDGGKQPFSNAVFDGEHIWLVPHDANMIIKISTKSGEISAAYSGIKKCNWAIVNSWYPFHSIERNRAMKANDTLYSGAVLCDDWIWFCPITAPTLIGIHLRTGEVREVLVALPREQDEQRNAVCRYPHPPKEGVDLRSTFNSSSFPLGSFVNMVSGSYEWSEKQRKEVCSSLANAEGTSGNEIWEYVMGHIE